jgi:hypothetical protein
MKPLLIALALLPLPALGEAACTLPAGWSKPEPHRAAASADIRFALKPGIATTLALLPAAKVKLAAVSDHKAKPDTSAGLAAIDIPRSGTLEIALSDRAYADLVQGGRVIASSAHREGCGGVRKIVSFPVSADRYLIQLTDAPAPTIVMQAHMGK